MKYNTNVNIPKLETQQNVSTTSYFPIKTRHHQSKTAVKHNKKTFFEIEKRFLL